VVKSARSNGVLWLKRQQVPEEIDIKYEYCKEEKGVKFSGKFPRSYHDLARAIESGEMAIRCCYLIDEIVCSLCKDNFVDCKCSVVLDGATKIMKKCEPLGAFLTDKPA
jgi:hypothetical protein